MNKQSGTDLTSALEAWRAHPDPSIADAIRGLSSSLLAAFAAPKARTRDQFHAAWMSIAGADLSPEATGWLAANLDHLVPVQSDRFGILRAGWMAEKYAATFARISALRRRCPDPRIADAALVMLREGKYGFWDRRSVEEVYRPVVDLLLAAGDPAAASSAREIASSSSSKRSTVRDWLKQELPPIAAKLESAAVEPLSETNAERWRALASPAAPPRAAPRDSNELFREVLARPDDDAVRSVLADLLIEACDPRGQLLSLQLRGVTDDPLVRKLLRAHRAEWLGAELEATLAQVVFRRGFPEEASLRSNASASREVWEAAAKDERLATIRILHQGQGNREHYLRFLMSEQARDLREVEIPTQAFVAALAGGPVRPLERLVFGAAPKRPVLTQIAQAPALASVRALRLGDALSLDRLVTDVVAAGLAPRLTALSIDITGRPGGDGPALPRLGQIAQRLDALREIELIFGLSTATATRDERGWTLTIDTRASPGVLILPDIGGVGYLSHGNTLPPRPPDVTSVLLIGASAAMAASLAEIWSCDVQTDAPATGNRGEHGTDSQGDAV